MRRLPATEIERLAECLVPFASHIMIDIPDHGKLPLPQQRAIHVAAAKLLLHCPTIRRNAQLWTHHRDAILTMLGHWGTVQDVPDGSLILVDPLDDGAFCEATDFRSHEKRWGRYNIIPAELDRLESILTEIETEISNTKMIESNAD